jgi:hypothetical protein
MALVTALGMKRQRKAKARKSTQLSNTQLRAVTGGLTTADISSAADDFFEYLTGHRPIETINDAL